MPFTSIASGFRTDARWAGCGGVVGPVPSTALDGQDVQVAKAKNILTAFGGSLGLVPASRIDDLLAIASSALTVEQIATPDPLALPASASAHEALNDLRARSFDFALIDESPLGRYVTVAALEIADGHATLQDVAKPITTRELIAAGAGLADGIERLAQLPVLFVFRRDGKLGIITTADLQRPAVGMIALSYVLVAEAGLVTVLERQLGSGLLEALRAALSPVALERAEGLHELKRQRHAELTLAASLTLSHRLEVVRCSAELRHLLGYESKRAVEAEKKRLTHIRDALAHAGDMLSAADGDPARAIRELALTRSFAEKVRGALQQLGVSPSGGLSLPN